MSYLELYIKGSCAQDPIASGITMYLLPGLLDYHTAANVTDGELVEWKREYNRWLDIVRKGTYRLATDDTMTAKEQKELRYNLEHWKGLMYDLLQQIGRYTNREMLRGFPLE
jgi:hypothetical protein